MILITERTWQSAVLSMSGTDAPVTEVRLQNKNIWQ
jgi:hypothetical protein